MSANAPLACHQVRVKLLDRWRLDGTIPENRTSLLMCNYLSIGVDAKAALLRARLNERAPMLFKLRLLSKVSTRRVPVLERLCPVWVADVLAHRRLSPRPPLAQR